MKVPSIRITALTIILLLAFVVRLYGINSQPLDWHAFRQSDTASVTREYVKNGIDLLRPRYHDVSSIQSGMDNPEGYRMVEFPLINALVASIVQLLPFASIEVTHRLVSVIGSLFSIVFLFALVKSLSGYRVALVSAAVFALLPYNIFYSRVILPEPILVTFLLLSLWSFQRWLTRPKVWWWGVISSIALALGFLLKPFVVFFAPVYVALAWTLLGRSFWRMTPILIVYAAISVLPLWWWRTWITQFPAGIPGNLWLLNGDGIRLRPAWWRWLGYERVIKLLLGYIAILPAFWSWIKLSKQELLVYGSWLAGSVSYLIVVATGNVRHDYYQVLIVPIISIVIARGVIMLQQFLSQRMLPILATITAITVLLIGVTLSWLQVREYYKILHWEYIRAGEAVRRLTPEDALIITNANGDTMLLYQTHRRGWPIGLDIEDKIERGATHYLSTSYDGVARTLEERYFTVEKTPEYLLLDLTRERQE